MKNIYRLILTTTVIAASLAACSVEDPVAGVPEEAAREALRLASHKLPLKTKFIKRAAENVTEAEGEE